MPGAKPMPLISIIMPAHNAERYLMEAIASVQTQTYANWELIVIDDASTDGTAEILVKLTDPRIRTFRVSRIGSPAGVRNYGFNHIRGEYIAFLDADDRYFPDALAKLLDALQADSSRIAAYGFASNMNALGEPIRERDLLVPAPNGDWALPPNYKHEWSWIVTGNISCLLPGLMMPADTIRKVGVFNEALYSGEDYEFYIRLFLAGFEHVYAMPDYIYQYRVYADSMTKQTGKYRRILDSVISIMDWLFTDVPLPKEVRALKSKAYVSCYRYLARERLVHDQPELTRELALLALENPNIKRADWICQCLPLLIRSVIPTGLDRVFITLRSELRTRYHLRKIQPKAY